MKTVIFDIDGTIADIEHRRHFVQSEKPNWTEFNNRMGDDSPNAPIVDLYKTLWEAGQHNLIFVTGRNERFRKVTETWLAWNAIPFHTLLMRADKDYRADNLIKLDILKALKAEGHEIAFTVDDRQQVVDMWRANGVTCLQCAPGNF